MGDISCVSLSQSHSLLPLLESSGDGEVLPHEISFKMLC